MSRDSKFKGLGIVEVIQIVLIVLKLTSLIDWRWKYVFLPLEIEIGLLVLIFVWCYIKYLLEKIFGW